MLVRRIFFDFEFMEDGNTIIPISLGLVDELNNRLYMVNKEADLSLANDFVTAEVIPNLYPSFIPTKVVTKQEMAQKALEFININSSSIPYKIEMWGYYADYDWVCFCQLYGRMVDIPNGLPMFAMDIKQVAEMYGNPELPSAGKGEHNALADAYCNKRAYNYLMSGIADGEFQLYKPVLKHTETVRHEQWYDNFIKYDTESALWNCYDEIEEFMGSAYTYEKAIKKVLEHAKTLVNPEPGAYVDILKD